MLRSVLERYKQRLVIYTCKSDTTWDLSVATCVSSIYHLDIVNHAGGEGRLPDGMAMTQMHSGDMIWCGMILISELASLSSKDSSLAGSSKESSTVHVSHRVRARASPVRRSVSMVSIGERRVSVVRVRCPRRVQQRRLGCLDVHDDDATNDQMLSFSLRDRL